MPMVSDLTLADVQPFLMVASDGRSSPVLMNQCNMHFITDLGRWNRIHPTNILSLLPLFWFTYLSPKAALTFTSASFTGPGKTCSRLLIGQESDLSFK